MRALFSVALLTVFSVVFAGCGRGGDSPVGASRAIDDATQKVSAFGAYEGYSDHQYDGYERRSEYVTVRDGVRIAVDYFLPTKGGERATEKLPVVFHMTPYSRALVIDGRVQHMLAEDAWLENPNPYLELSRRGYVMASVDVRGQGASFGKMKGQGSLEEGQDGADIVAWFAEQPWSNGKVGMLGDSYLGVTQYSVAIEAPPALKAIFPVVAGVDTPVNVAPGGVLYQAALGYIQLLNDLSGRSSPEEVNVAPVDGPDGPALLQEALSERMFGDEVQTFVESAATPEGPNVKKYRDELFSVRDSGILEAPLVQRFGPGRKVTTPAYHFGGWNDLYSREALLAFVNWGGPNKMAITAGTHFDDEPGDPRGVEMTRLMTLEAVRWFDYWLKDIDNGVLEGPAINYAVLSDVFYSERDAKSGYTLGSWEWRTAETWPPAGGENVTMTLADGPSGSIDSLNDGRLTSGEAKAGRHVLKVDESVSTGTTGRFVDSVIGGPVEYPDMRENDRKSLTYTTDVLDNDLVVIGAPVVKLFAQSTHADGDVHAWLEEVDTDGYSTLVSFGSLRAAVRTLGEPDYDSLGPPWLTHRSADIANAAPFNSGVVKLEFKLLPTAAKFRKGKRIRLTVAGADSGAFITTEPDATITVSFGGDYPSSLQLPVYKQ